MDALSGGPAACPASRSFAAHFPVVLAGGASAPGERYCSPKCAAVPLAWPGCFFGLVLDMVGELRKVKRKEPPSGPPPSTSHLFVSAPEDLNPDLFCG